MTTGASRVQDRSESGQLSGTAAYDAGYARCECFWGREPGSLVGELVRRVGSVVGWRVLDVGCGEGKNADHLRRLGAAEVVALDASALALRNAERAFPKSDVRWWHADVRTATLESGAYDLVIAYGLLHCLADLEEVRRVVSSLRDATRPQGRNIVCAFNDRFQDLSAHPGFQPCLLPHATYAALYADWNFEVLSDTDLHEVHPHNGIEHVHSMTRLIARRG